MSVKVTKKINQSEMQRIYNDLSEFSRFQAGGIGNRYSGARREMTSFIEESQVKTRVELTAEGIVEEELNTGLLMKEIDSKTVI